MAKKITIKFEGKYVGILQYDEMQINNKNPKQPEYMFFFNNHPVFVTSGYGRSIEFNETEEMIPYMNIIGE